MAQRVLLAVSSEGLTVQDQCQVLASVAFQPHLVNLPELLPGKGFLGQQPYFVARRVDIFLRDDSGGIQTLDRRLGHELVQ